MLLAAGGPWLHDPGAMQMREAAERVLRAETLEEKLCLPPAEALDDLPGRALVTPAEGPGRPPELKMCPEGVNVKFPGTHHLDRERERGVMMHFLANHELLAAELMALVLLKFPDAPKAYRAGVYEAMREEQMHTLMYVRRMRECGIEFGELPLNDYFWRLVSPVESPMDFVVRLNLTFEQANLDFSKHYAALFRQVGDTATSAVLEKIYHDEIGHVGHGVKWFRRWKKAGSTDWRAFCEALDLPFSPVRAKGIAPFNAEGRRKAGFDEDFINHLEVFGQSRGRTPVLAWFNPDAESEVLAARVGRRRAPNAMVRAMEEDLEVLALAWCHPDDMALLRKVPSTDHLARLQAAGLEIPELVRAGEIAELAGRRLGGFRPWAWSPETSEMLSVLRESVSGASRWPWRESLPPEWLSKELGWNLSGELDPEGDSGSLCRSSGEVLTALDEGLAAGPVLLKAAHACAGRGHLRVMPGGVDDKVRAWIESAVGDHGCVLVEPWLVRVLDFSALYDADGSGGMKFHGMTVMENDEAGRFRGTRVAPKWTSLVDPELAKFLFGGAGAHELYGGRVPGALAALLPGYAGPVGVDAMVHRKADGSLGLRPVVEVNVRMTMGRVAHELWKTFGRPQRGRLRILRKREWRDGTGGLPLNDPAAAREFIAVWA